MTMHWRQSRSPTVEGQSNQSGCSAGASNAERKKACAEKTIQYPARSTPTAPVNLGRSDAASFYSSERDREFAAWCFVGAMLIGISVLIFSIYFLVSEVGVLELVAFD